MKTLLLEVLLVSVLVVPAFAGWTVTDLHPSGAYNSGGWGNYRDITVGGIGTATSYHASMWNGTADSWVDLNPAGALRSLAYSTSGNSQVGYVNIHEGSNDHASLWSGVANNWIDLNPAGATQSTAYASSVDNQGGYATIGGSSHAGIWNGTANSWIDLNPRGVYESRVYGMSDDKQVGFTADIYYNCHASLWSGTSSSWVDLDPTGAIRSCANGVSGNKQIGYASFGGQEHAGMWSGTADSWVDLNPTGANSSCAKGVSNDMVVGLADLRGINQTHAYLWNITDNSELDLHSILPQEGAYLNSNAMGIDVIGNDIWISGYASSAIDNKDHAIIWHYTTEVVPEPSSLLALGTLIAPLGFIYRKQKR